MLKPHHRKNIRQGMWQAVIALAGLLLILLVLQAHQTTAYLEEQARGYEAP